VPTLSLSHVTFTWPDGRPLFTDLTLAIPPGLTGVVGRNGIGKTTLLRLLTGELTPQAGTVTRAATWHAVPQHLTLEVGRTVADVLGIGGTLAALRAIENGSLDQAHFDAVGDDWLVEERARAAVASLGLDLTDLDHTVGALSGGEATLLAVAAALTAQPELLVLDEPTNNLDARARTLLRHRLRARTGATLVVTHDRALLREVDHILELVEREDRTVQVNLFGGALADYEVAKAAQADAAHQAVVTARGEARRQQRLLVAHQDGAARKAAVGVAARRDRKVVGMAANARRNRAEATDATARQVHRERLEEAQAALAQAQAAIPRDRSIRVDLPDTRVPPRRQVALLEGVVTRAGHEVTARIVGPERIHLAGPNGSGKTTLLDTLRGALTPRSGTVTVAVPVGYLPQRLTVVKAELTVLENVRLGAPDVPLQQIRDELGRFQFRGAAVDALAGRLSGGERFRAALAMVLLARPAPQLLLLDEPTNNLDFESQAHLSEALEGYGGALVVVSHDPDFVDGLGLDRRWELPGSGRVDTEGRGIPMLDS